jgi:hypothetical protein
LEERFVINWRCLRALSQRAGESNEKLSKIVNVRLIAEPMEVGRIASTATVVVGK